MEGGERAVHEKILVGCLIFSKLALPAHICRTAGTKAGG
jgi:hypothetical protein